MKRHFVTGILMMTLFTVTAQSRDTTFIKRPFYLGVSVGYIHWMHIYSGNQFTPPVNLGDLPYTRQINFGISPAIQLSFPFLRRMEFESAIQRTTYFGTRSEVVEYQYSTSSTNQVVGFRTVRKWFDQSVWQVRAIFAYEFKRKQHYALVAGLGGWLDLQDLDYGNNYGAEAQLKCYWQPEHFGNYQLSLSAGANGFDVFAIIRVGIMLKGTRTYRLKPDKYYVRTYEEGE